MSHAKKYGLLNELQVEILKLRARGLTQAEIAKRLNLSRSYVSMIELRAKRKIKAAEETLKIVSLIQSQELIVIRKGTRLAEIPLVVLKAADKRRIHLKTNIIEIIRMVKLANPPCIRKGRTVREITFKVSSEGRLILLYQ
ncbi:MAG: Tfx family DNA-binding protein [Thermoproteota archaeon]